GRGERTVPAGVRGDDALAHAARAVGAQQGAAGGGQELDAALGPPADRAAGRVRAARHQPPNLPGARGSTILSMSPYSSACCGDMKRSRSMSARSFSREWPVWRWSISSIMFRMSLNSRAWTSRSRGDARGNPAEPAWIMIREWGRATLWPFSPAIRMAEPIDIAMPTQFVCTGAEMYCMTS